MDLASHHDGIHPPYNLYLFARTTLSFVGLLQFKKRKLTVTPYTEYPYPFLGFASLQPLLIRLIRKNNFVVCRTASSASLLAVKKRFCNSKEASTQRSVHVKKLARKEVCAQRNLRSCQAFGICYVIH